MGKPDQQKLIAETQRKMEAAAKDLDFLQAARYRDEMVQRCEIGSCLATGCKPAAARGDS